MNVGDAPPEPTTPAPAITPTLLAVTYVGGAGNQYIRSVSVADDGTVVARGKGFEVTYTNGAGTVSGNVATDDAEAYSEKPTLYKDWNTSWSSAKHAKRLDDPRTGLSFFVGTKQVASDLMQPIALACVTGQDCDVRENQKLRLWDWWASVCKERSPRTRAATTSSCGQDGMLVIVKLWD